MGIQRLKKYSEPFCICSDAHKKKEKGVYVRIGKTKILAVLAEVSVYFEGAGKFIQERMEEIFDPEKVSVKETIYFLVLWYVVSLPLPLKIVVCYAKESCKE